MNFVDVTNITISNKEVIKIQDSNGIVLWEQLPQIDYLCFTAEEANSTVKLHKVGTISQLASFKISYNRIDWEDYTLNTVITLANIGDKIYWRGNNSILSNLNGYYHFQLTGKIAASGTVNSLLSQSAELSNYCFMQMFVSNTALTQAPSLPATQLATGCYQGMFSHCSSLTTAPQLPATSLKTNCYNGIFWNCTLLNNIKLNYIGNFSSAYFLGWVDGVSEIGDFYYNGNDATRGVDAIPEGWTVHTF